MSFGSCGRRFCLSSAISLFIFFVVLMFGLIGGLIATLQYEPKCTGMMFYNGSFECYSAKNSWLYSDAKVFEIDPNTSLPRVYYPYGTPLVYSCNKSLCPGAYGQSYNQSLVKINSTMIVSYPNTKDTSEVFYGRVYTSHFSYLLGTRPRVKFNLYIAFIFGMIFSFIGIVLTLMWVMIAKDMNN
jgi:hypothetical protein